ncbi:MAG: sulfite exporter TauE/SafE family protein [Actinomycetota bacterium]|nr:sulfite exporter TauE/SafE family protein [Actinomycetota bacterium]
MHITILSAIAIVAIGLASGVLSALFGVGGAVLTTPGVRLLGLSPILSVGSTIPAILPGAVTGSVRYNREGLISWRIGLVCGASGAAFAIAGAEVSDHVNAHLLMVLTAGLLMFSGVQAALPARAPVGDAPAPPADAAVTSTATIVRETGPAPATTVSTGRLVLVGSAAGFVAGLLGVGGGIVLVPVFTGLLHLRQKEAVASSLVAVAIFSVPALITHSILGHVNWAVALLLAVGVVPGARFGSHLTVSTSDQTLRLLCGAFFVVLAIIYGGSELHALL